MAEASAVTTEQSSGNALTLSEFVELLQKLSPAQIKGLPLDKLPRNIPADIIDRVPSASKGAVDDLLMAANSFHLKRRIQDQQRYGDPILNALDQAKLTGESATIRVFKNKILSLIDTLQSASKEKKPVSNDGMVKLITAINNLLIDVRSESQSMLRALDVLDQAKPDDADKERFAKSIIQLRSTQKSTDKILSEFYILRLKIFSQSISQKRKLIEARDKSGQAMREELGLLRAELEKNNGFWKKTIHRKSSMIETEAVQGRIQQLVGQIKENEVIISENDLILWLDTIVEASLNATARERIAKSLHTTRISLYYLLNRFCAAQEESAIQIAQNPFLQVEPEKAIRFVLKSEQFILDYFSKKRNNPGAWLSGAAENKIAELDQLQKDILAELKKASRSIFK